MRLSGHKSFVIPAVTLVLVLFASSAMALGERAAADGPNPPLYTLTPPGSGCSVGGCNGELCMDEGTVGDMATTCAVEPEHACYHQFGQCVRENGVCGWKQTPQLQECLKNPPGNAAR